MARNNSSLPAEDFVIEEASRDQALLRLLLQGPSSGGKTTTALLIAAGMVKALGALGKLPGHLNRQIGLICTERGSARKASHITPFDLLVLSPPYSPQRYRAALARMERIGYPVIIIDQISHEWSGEGGVLQMVANSKEFNDFAKWNGPSQDHEEFIDSLLHSPAHLICTARAKTEWLLVEKEKNGRIVKAPERIGMQARQREGTEFEFDTVLDLRPGSNEVRCIKDRCELFVVDETYARLDSRAGERFVKWIYSAPTEVDAAARVSPADRAAEMAEASVRAIEGAPNLPELERVFLAEQRVLRDYVKVAGRDVIVPLLERLTAAKDARKACFVPVAGYKPAGLVSDLDPAEVAIPAREPDKPDAVGTVDRIVGKLQKERDAGGLFSEMPDDLPWRDEDEGAPPGACRLSTKFSLE